MMQPNVGDILVYIDQRQGIHVGRVQQWAHDEGKLLLADQTLQAGDMIYQRYFLAKHRPAIPGVYTWPSDAPLPLTFTRLRLPGAFKHVKVTAIQIEMIYLER